MPGTNAISVRIATATDAAALSRLNAAFQGSGDDAATLAVRLAEPGLTERALLAEVDGRAVGFAGLRVSPGLFYAEPRAELTELYVEPEARRHGVGRALIATAAELARRAGAEELWALTWEQNHAALALYRAMGFVGGEVALRKELS
jgi:ribosomal protein S18 acetylase RimI-like enzyme